MEKTFEKVTAAMEGKISSEHGLALYSSAAEFLKATGHEKTEGLSSWIDMELPAEFAGSFIVYDYQNTDFMFLTNVDDVGKFLDRILAK